MGETFATYPSLGSALNAQFRGHADRNWEQWRVSHFYGAASAIPSGAERAWLIREKVGYRSLAEKQALRHLIAGNVDQPFLEEIGQLRGLTRLELEWPFVANDLTPLLALKSLKFLSIDSPRKVSDFAALLELPALRTLILTNARLMTDIKWLKNAHHLEVLGIEGGMWSPYTLPALRPLSGLKSLRAFLGISTKLADKQLMPLADCPKLQFVAIARVAPREEFERLHAARPDVYCDWFQPEIWTAMSSRRRKASLRNAAEADLVQQA